MSQAPSKRIFVINVDALVLWATFIFFVLVVGYLLTTVIKSAESDQLLLIESSQMKKNIRTVTFDTSMGSIRIALERKKAPVATATFIDLVRSGFYDGTKFHKVVPDGYIEGGDPLSREDDRDLYGTGGPGFVYEDENVAQKLRRGMVALGNRGKPDSNGSIFFIVVGDDLPARDGKHTVIGRVTEGLDIAEKISLVEIDRDGIPKSPVTISEAEAE